MLLIPTVAVLIAGCANELSYEMTTNKMIYVPDYTETETSQTTVPMPCDVAIERAAAMLRTTVVEVNVNKLEMNRLTTTVYRYPGTTKGLIFKTRYMEDLVFVFDFNQSAGKQESCQVALRGMVCERPEDVSWECIKIQDHSRAVVHVTGMLKKLEQEVK